MAQHLNGRIEFLFIKIFYLPHTSFILNIDCIVVFYVTKQTKLDLTCIYVEDFYTDNNLYVNLSFDIIKEVATCIIDSIFVATFALHAIHVN